MNCFKIKACPKPCLYINMLHAAIRTVEWKTNEVQTVELSVSSYISTSHTLSYTKRVGVAGGGDGEALSDGLCPSSSSFSRGRHGPLMCWL